MTHKKTCNRCKAFGGSDFSGGFRCDLGYQIGEALKPVPMEHCPKPLTIGAFHITLTKWENEVADAAKEER